MVRHTYSCAVRWFDMDAFGHVNNVTFLRYLEEARMDFAVTHAWDSDRLRDDAVAVVAQHDIAYLRPLRYRSEPVTVELWITSLDDSAFTLAYEIKDEPGEPGPANTVYVRAATVMVPYDLGRSRRRALSAHERSTYATFLRSDAVPA